MDQKPFVGVWMDHRQAFLFWADEYANIDSMTVKSGYQEEGEPTERLAKPGPSNAGGGVAHASLEHRREEQLKRYYKRLDKTLRPAEQIFLFGPGQAKKGLESVLKKDKGHRARIRKIENADKKMTTPQMAAKVRQEFGLPRT